MKKYKESKSTSKYGRKYTDEFKHFVCQDYLKGEKTKADLWREHIGGDSEHGNLTKWLRELGYLSTRKKPPISFPIFMSKKEPSKLSPEELEKRIQELEKALEDSQLQSQMYKRMIEIAEEELNINIRKKSNTK